MVMLCRECGDNIFAGPWCLRCLVAQPDHPCSQFGGAHEQRKQATCEHSWTWREGRIMGVIPVQAQCLRCQTWLGWPAVKAPPVEVALPAPEG